MGEWPWDGDRDVNEAEPLVDDVDAWDAAAVPGHELRALVAELRRLLGSLPALGVALPDDRDVRAALAGKEGGVSDPTTGMAVVDFDIGGMIMPIGMEDWQLRADTWTPVERVAASMVGMLAHAVRHRRKLLRRERKMREGFERDVASLGGGAAPLWLRLEPLRFDGRVSDMFRMPYVALDVRLGIHQVWAPVGDRAGRIATPAAQDLRARQGPPPPQRGAARGDASDGVAGLDQRCGAGTHRAGRSQPGRGVPGGARSGFAPRGESALRLRWPLRHTLLPPRCPHALLHVRQGLL